jgi:hypothetical protein
MALSVASFPAPAASLAYTLWVRPVQNATSFLTLSFSSARLRRGDFDWQVRRHCRGVDGAGDSTGDDDLSLMCCHDFPFRKLKIRTASTHNALTHGLAGSQGVTSARSG